MIRTILVATFLAGSSAVAFAAGNVTLTDQNNQYFGPISFSRIPSSAATLNATVAKTSPGRVYKIIACNTTVTAARIKFYNVATTPVPGTTPVMFSRTLPAAGVAGALACQSYDVSFVGWLFSTGISYALTAGATDADTTAVAAGAITDVSVEYQ